MLNNEITERFFGSIDGMRKVEDVKLIDMLIGGCEIVGIEEDFALCSDGSDIPGINIFFKNATKDILAFQIFPHITQDGKLDITLNLCKPEFDNETEKSQENSWDNIPHLTDER